MNEDPYTPRHLKGIAEALKRYQAGDGLSMRAADALLWAAEEIDHLNLNQPHPDHAEMMEVLTEKLQALHHKLLAMAGVTHFPPETRQ